MTWRSHHIGDHPRHHMGAEGGGIDLADALDAVVGHQLQEDEIAPAEARRRIADDEGLELPDLHDFPFGIPPRRMAWLAEKSETTRFSPAPGADLRAYQTSSIRR